MWLVSILHSAVNDLLSRFARFRTAQISAAGSNNIAPATWCRAPTTQGQRRFKYSARLLPVLNARDGTESHESIGKVHVNVQAQFKKCMKVGVQQRSI